MKLKIKLKIKKLINKSFQNKRNIKIKFKIMNRGKIIIRSKKNLVIKSFKNLKILVLRA